jgi:hypothetical protein
MNWTEKNKPVPIQQEISDSLAGTGVSIDYAPYKSACIFLSLPYDKCRSIDPNDRDGTRARVLWELLPMAEAAVEALRQAVAELDADDWSEPTNGTRDPATGEILYPAATE